ncbi:unnamed protein product [Brachionus calyciflorus]|uniref:Uncharacterized protein n=1 Tax=Brachionus calyciflorus TaxID=104777 RepID=A0A814B006_9BILA|nr:unnamed protein product [Brachionus calyciflorus]
MKLGLAGTNIPKELLDKLSSAEELEKMLAINKHNTVSNVTSNSPVHSPEQIIENIETIENLLVLNNEYVDVEDNDDDDELNENENNDDKIDDDKLRL